MFSATGRGYWRRRRREVVVGDEDPRMAAPTHGLEQDCRRVLRNSARVLENVAANAQSEHGIERDGVVAGGLQLGDKRPDEMLGLKVKRSTAIRYLNDFSEVHTDTPDHIFSQRKLAPWTW